MAQEPKTGHRCKLYRNDGTVETPTWEEVAEIGDVNIPDLTRGLAEMKRRASDFTKNLASIVQTIACEFTMFHGLDPTMFTKIRTDFFSGSVIQWAIMDGDITAGVGQDNEGLICPMIVEQFPWNQPLEDVNSHDIRLAIGYMQDASDAEVDPVWTVVGT